MKRLSTPLALALAGLAGCTSVRSRVPSDARSSSPELKGDPTPPGIPAAQAGAASEPASVAPAPIAPTADDSVLDWQTGAGKSYLIPALDIVGFQFLLNQFDRHMAEEDSYGTDINSIKDNLDSGWVIDNDPFATNQFLHPYQGSIYHGFARSAGLNYWEALGYDFAGSTLWELAGETDPPSLNDEITTTFGGSFLGESLFRLSNLLLEGGGTTPGPTRRFFAGLISPAAGFNRLAFGSRFDTVYSSHDAATFWSTSIGATRNATLSDAGDLSNLGEEGAIANVIVEYGLPGKAGYEYERPFDYFHFEATLTSSTHAIPENIQARGLLAGTDYEGGDSYRGIWGLYGSYDYISPELFSVSSTALSLGTTGQYQISDNVALQGTAMGGVGWTAVGTIADAEEDRDYRYGWSPQALLQTRWIFGDIVMFDLTGHDWYIDGTSSRDDASHENIFRAQAALTVRVFEHHAVGIQFVASRRDASFSDLSDSLQEVGALSIVYTYLGDTKLGAVKW